MEHLSLDVLRTFITIVELKGFNLAAEKVHLSQSAISMQIKKLEDLTGQVLLERRGRQWLLTHQGEILLSYARKMLDLNDEVLLALRETRLKGKMRIGVQGDLMASRVPAAVYRFVKNHPEILVDWKVDSSDALQSLLLARKLDLAMYLANEANPRLDAERLGSFPLHWIAPASDEGAIVHRSPLPLVVLGPECKMRQAASEALTQAGIPWRIVFGSNHLPAMFGAVFAGIGISARTKVGLPEGVRVLPKTVQLPPLPSVHAFLCSAPGEDRRAVLGLKQFLQAEVSLI